MFNFFISNLNLLEKILPSYVSKECFLDVFNDVDKTSKNIEGGCYNIEQNILQ